MKVEGSLTNKADRRRAYNVVVDFNTADGTKVGDDAGVHTSMLDPGQRSSWSGSSPGFAGPKLAGITCKVTQVNYWGV